MKTCKKDNCHNPIFGKGYCKYHQHLRTDRILKPIEPLSSSKMNNVSKKKIKPLKTLKNDEYNLFKEIWNERPHKSEVSGIPIDKFDKKNFHHILTKGAYPEHRLNKDNIVILTFNEHRQAHDNTWEELIVINKAWEHIYKKYINIKESKNE